MSSKKNSKYLKLGGKHLEVTQATANFVRSRIVIENTSNADWNTSVNGAVDRLVQVPFLVKMLQEYLKQHPSEKIYLDARSNGSAFFPGTGRIGTDTFDSYNSFFYT